MNEFKKHYTFEEMNRMIDIVWDLIRMLERRSINGSIQKDDIAQAYAALSLMELNTSIKHTKCIEQHTTMEERIKHKNTSRTNKTEDGGIYMHTRSALAKYYYSIHN
jgi:hypothetical protein